MRTRWLLAVLLCGAAARAQQRTPSPRPPERKDEARKPLSKEDAELVKDLALLERLELLRNLDLFEAGKGEDRTAKEETPR
jgi:hypothetical protein